jgi:hypothetical protein
VIACRVSLDPLASREMDCGAPFDSFSISANRASAPNAAKAVARILSPTGRLVLRLISSGALALLLQMTLDIAQLLSPTIFVHPERFELAILRQGVKSGFC